jgi:hypothetical protein
VERAVVGNPLSRGLVLALVASLAACAGNEPETLLSADLDCPSPSVEQIEPWGKSGSQQICKIKHGPFIAWENGYIHLRGHYQNGEKAGVWKWYDRSGKVVKEIDYSRVDER